MTGRTTPRAFGDQSPDQGHGAGHSLSRLSVLRPQAKLTVNQPGDHYEQEANSVADQVMRSADTTPLSWGRPVSLLSVPLVQRADAPDPPDPPSAREKDKPGGPTDWNDKGLTCGIGYDGKFTCNLDIGKGDPLSISKPDGPKGPSMPSRPKDCPEKRWNWMFEYCCGPDKMFDPDSKNCVRDFSAPNTEMLPLPPPDHSDWGDYPLPSDDTANA